MWADVPYAIRAIIGPPERIRIIIIGSMELGSCGNELLASLTADDRRFVVRNAQRRTFKLGEVLHSTDGAAHPAYFVESGVASVLKVDDAGRKTEICLLGPEQFFGAATVAGSEMRPFEIYSQANPLTVIVVPASDLRELIARSRVAADLFSAAMYAQYIQIADNLVSAVWQPVAARLARWLYMYRERMKSERLEITHAFLAIMIGAQRSKVTSALHELESCGAITSGRGFVQVRDLNALRSAARKGVDGADE